MDERPDLGERPARAARKGDGQRIGSDPERGDERHPDDRSHAALQDAEPVPGLGRLGSPSPTTARTATGTRCSPSSLAAATAWAAAATVFRVTSRTGRPAGRNRPTPAAGRLTGPMSQAGRSRPAKVVTPAPP